MAFDEFVFDCCHWNWLGVFASLRRLVFVVVAVAFSLFMNLFSYWFSDKIVLTMSGAHPIKREENLEFYRIVENLCITAGLNMPKLYVINDESPNAFATGRNQKHSAVAVTSGLLRTLNKNELEGVIAHELSHIGNKDILISTIVVILVGFVALLSDFFLRAQFFRGRRRQPRRRRTSPACNNAGRNYFGHSRADCRYAYPIGDFPKKGISSRRFRRAFD